jgi:4-amino-4-deoxy-L-arabinose transferase-like glycosyltransferase
MSDAGTKRNRLVSLMILIAVCLSCLMPFINKAYHIDDPLYLWAARQIQSNPLDFYGFMVNWYQTKMPMFEVINNPPLAPYYIAIISSLFGWAETTLHIAFLISAVAAVIGTYYLASEFCSMPLVATLVGVLTPVFLLSSTTIMCDIMMMMFWVWATLIWIRSLKRNSAIGLISATILIALSSLSKYYGMCLIPLLFIYSLAKKRNLGRWAFFLLIPILALAGYQWLTYTLYGRGLLSIASSYALERQKLELVQLIVKSATGLFFTGGCFISVFFFSFLLWRKRSLVIGAVLILLLTVYYLYAFEPNGLIYNDPTDLNWTFIFQCFLFSASGIGVLFLAISDFWRHKDADSLFLFLWVIGTFIFASYLNWSVTSRTILPMFPVVGMLVIRRIEQNSDNHGMVKVNYVLVPLILSLVVALSVTWADYKWADAARSTADALNHRYRNYPGTVWFQGHWGFQYYMEKYGGKAFDINESDIPRGDILIVPPDNSSKFLLHEDMLFLDVVYKVTPGISWLSTLNKSTGAGFYSSKWGPLPYAFGPVPEVAYNVFIVAGKH